MHLKSKKKVMFTLNHLNTTSFFKIMFYITEKSPQGLVSRAYISHKDEGYQMNTSFRLRLQAFHLPWRLRRSFHSNWISSIKSLSFTDFFHEMYVGHSWPFYADSRMSFKGCTYIGAGVPTENLNAPPLSFLALCCCMLCRLSVSNLVR